MSDPSPTRLHAARRTASLQERVSAAILEAAAHVLASRGEQASMADVAAAAGVARATVYRYFPNRSALLDALAGVAVRDAAERFAAARIDAVQPGEAIARAIRVLVEGGDAFVVLARERGRLEPGELAEEFAGPLRRLFERAQAAGAIRDDVPSAWLANSLVGLVASALSTKPSLGTEDTIVAITSLFIEGAAAQGRGASEG